MTNEPTPPDSRADATRARLLLHSQVGAVADNVQPLVEGIFSRAYAGSVDGREYVVRLNRAPHAAESFAKDDYAARRFASPKLPIPQVIATGQLDDDAFAISERCPGRRMDELTPPERLNVLPSLLDTLDAIGRADVRASHGYGDWHEDGDADFTSWRGFLGEIGENEGEGFFADWHALFRESFLERDLFDAVYRRMLQIAEHVPEERGLIHNDYWNFNILADGEQVTGVIDWANALYGDPLYDITRLSWGSAWPNWWYDDGAALLRARYGALPGYNERLACYSCHIGLGDLRYFAKAGLRAEYDFFRPRILALIAT